MITSRTSRGPGKAEAGKHDLIEPADRARPAPRTRVTSIFPLPPVARAEVASRFLLEDADEDAAEPDQLGRPDILLVGPPRRVDSAFLARLPDSVRGLATYSVGLDHIDLGAVRDRGLALFNTPAVLSNAVADHAMLLILAATRRLTETTALLRSGRWTDMRSNQILGFELEGKTLGILGMGDIGTRVARRAAAFGMTVIYHNRKPAPDEAGSRFVAHVPDFLGEAEVLLLAAPSTAETRNFINEDRLAMARDGLIVINIARGDLIDDQSLLSALASGKVRAAGLDVFRSEPDVDPGYLALPNVVLTPHVGSATEEARRNMGLVLCDAIESWRRGERPANQVI